MTEVCYTRSSYNAATPRGSKLLPCGDTSQASALRGVPISISKEDSQCQDSTFPVQSLMLFASSKKTTPVKRIVLPTSLYVDYADLLGGRSAELSSTAPVRRTKHVKTIHNRTDYWRMRGPTSSESLIEGLVRLATKVRRGKQS